LDVQIHLGLTVGSVHALSTVSLPVLSSSLFDRVLELSIYRYCTYVLKTSLNNIFDAIIIGIFTFFIPIIIIYCQTHRYPTSCEY
jgi:hypothetical protein